MNQQKLLVISDMFKEAASFDSMSEDQKIALLDKLAKTIADLSTTEAPAPHKRTMQEIIDSNMGMIDTSGITMPEAINVNIESDLEQIRAIAASEKKTIESVTNGVKIALTTLIKIAPLLL